MKHLVRQGPVHFQSLERELAPVRQHLTGAVLDAGCGRRDIRSFLLDAGATSVTRYDLDAADDEVVQGPLESMPFEDSTFDSALCNAVLEHVADAEASMAELARVVRPGGTIVAAVPFLQPFHAAPTDYRRFTADGLVQLGARHGLETVEITPVHSIAQTIGWILWEHAREKGGRLRKALSFALTFALTRLRHSSDPALRTTANTFQIVYRRPEDPQHAPRPAGGAPRTSDLPYEALEGIQRGTMAWRYRGVPTWKAPFDLALYSMLLDDLRPRTIVEIGSNAGGSARWFADQASLRDLDAVVVSVDLTPPSGVVHPGVRFVAGDAEDLGACLSASDLESLPRPWLVVEDSSHQATTTRAVLDFFDPWLAAGDYLVVEDGILTDLRVADSYGGGPLAAVRAFLADHPGRYEVDRTYCDHFGTNVTWNVDGFLRRTDAP